MDEATQHIEAIHVLYDPAEVSYDRLLEVFWHNIDPTQADGQFCDRGNQYTTAIFTSDPDERKPSAASGRPKPRRYRGHHHSAFSDVLGGGGLPPGLLQRTRSATTATAGAAAEMRLEALWGEKAGH